MNLDEFDQLRRHPAWRLLRADNAPLIVGFLGEHFVEQNHAATSANDLIAALDDELYAIHARDPERFPASAERYLDEWASSESGWLRRFYPADSDEVYFDATAALEKAYRWVMSLRKRSFVGTESRLHTLVELLRQIVHGTEEDPETRRAELQRRRDAIDAELNQLDAGEMPLLDETGVRDRYQQFASGARDLLSDFREVEENFRQLDRSARERIASWEGGKGELLTELVASRADIASSNQGRSFRAFHDFLLSEQRQDELADLLTSVQKLPAVDADTRLRRVHYDWADAAERTQRTVRSLSEQLRRFLDDQVWMENRRVADLVRRIEAAAVAVRDDPPGAGTVALTVDEPGVPISLPFERPLYSVRTAARVNSLIEPVEQEEINLDALTAQRFVDTGRLADNIRAIVPPHNQARLDDVLALYPPEEGIAEVLGYLSLADQDDIAVDIEQAETTIDYTDSAGRRRRVRMPEVVITHL